MNSGGAVFGLWAALASGGPLVELPLATGITDRNTLSGAALFPVPAQDEVSLRVRSTIDGRATLRIVDAAGRTVFERASTALMNGDNLLRIPLNGLTAGTYRLNVLSDGGSLNMPLQIVR